VLVAIDRAHRCLTITQDANADGIADSTEFTFSSALDGGPRFVIPSATVDGAAPDDATGPGPSHFNQNYAYPTATCYPSGYSSGNVVVYIGSSPGRSTLLRAPRITGAAARLRMYRMSSDETWRLSDM